MNFKVVIQVETKLTMIQYIIHIFKYKHINRKFKTRRTLQKMLNKRATIRLKHWIRMYVERTLIWKHILPHM